MNTVVTDKPEVTTTPTTIDVPTISREEEILLKAERLIREQGWRQYRRIDYITGEMCAIGAVERAIFGTIKCRRLELDPVSRKVIYYLNMATRSYGGIVAFNDSDCASKKGVLDKFEKARTIARRNA